jgi:hypothetical protein
MSKKNRCETERLGVLLFDPFVCCALSLLFIFSKEGLRGKVRLLLQVNIIKSSVATEREKRRDFFEKNR